MFREAFRSERFDSFEWVLRIVGAAVVNIVIFQFLAELTAQNTVNSATNSTTITGTSTQHFISVSSNYLFLYPPLAYVFYPVTIILYLWPLIGSLIFTKKNTDLESRFIVPPFYIAIISIAYFIVFILGFPNLRPTTPIESAVEPLNYLYSMMILMLLGVIAFEEDRIAVKILGYNADRNRIFFEKLSVNGILEEVKGKLLIPEIRSNLGVSQRIVEEDDSHFVLQGSTARRYDVDVVTKIGGYKDDENKHRTILKVAYYLRNRYSLGFTNYFAERTKKQSVYLHDVLNTTEPKMPSIDSVSLIKNGNDLFVEEVIGDLRGLYVRTQSASLSTVYLVASVLVLSILTAFLVITGQPTFASIASLTIDLVILVVAVIDYSRKRS